MSLFRNPLLVGTLVLVALGLILSNLIWPRAQGQRWRGAPSPLAETPRPAPESLPKASHAEPALAGVTPAAKPSPLLDWVANEASRARWMHSPRRDPFRSATGSGKRATAALTLQGIWRQPGGNFAVIDGHLVGEGDPIADLRVDKIEADRVWVTGPNGREELGFKPPTKRPPSTAEPELGRSTPLLER